MLPSSCKAVPATGELQEAVEDEAGAHRKAHEAHRPAPVSPAHQHMRQQLSRSGCPAGMCCNSGELVLTVVQAKTSECPADHHL